MASFLQSLTDVFTGRPGAEAARQQQAFIAQQQAANDARLRAAETGGIAALESGRTGAVGAIRPAFETARTDIAGATPQALDAIYRGETAGAGALTAAQPQALSALESGVSGAVAGYDPLLAAAGRYGTAGGGASNMSADALGLNGPEGVARAQAAFQAGPGFQFALGQGLESILRNANVSGMGAGGNVLRESQIFGQGLANQEFNNWLKNLAGREGLYAPLESAALGQAGSGVANALLTGGTGAANIYTGTGGRLADLYSTTGRAAAPVITGAGQSLADLASRGGLAEAGVYTDTAARDAALRQALAQTGSTFSQNTLTPMGTALTNQANAELGGSRNLWNAITAGAQLAAPGLSGAGGGMLPNTMLPGSGGGMFFTG